MQTGLVNEILSEDENIEPEHQKLENSSIKNSTADKERNKMDLSKGGVGATGVNRKMKTYKNKPKTSRLSVPTGGHDINEQQQHSYSNQIQIQTYLQRIFDIQQMDIQSALDQMQTLIFTTTPQRIYKTSYYRKQTKNHWARDDPAFVVLQILFLILASIAFCIAFRMVSLRNVIMFLFQNIVVNWFIVGVAVSSVGRMISIQYLTVHQSNHVKQYVEWLYAFDIHCNAFFPLFILLCKFAIIDSFENFNFSNIHFCLFFLRCGTILPTPICTRKVILCTISFEYTLCCSLLHLFLRYSFRL